jgi:hypothetical protein
MSFIVSIQTPLQVTSKRTLKLVETYARQGVRASQISLQMDFVTSDKVTSEIGHKFRVLKNKVYFKIK